MFFAAVCSRSPLWPVVVGVAPTCSICDPLAELVVGPAADAVKELFGHGGEEVFDEVARP